MAERKKIEKNWMQKKKEEENPSEIKQLKNSSTCFWESNAAWEIKQTK